jgi:formyltetrahydrofolate deformylase
LAIFVSKYDHCLYDLLLRHKAGEIHCDIPLIISNHLDLRYIADAFNIDFYHIPTEDKALAEGQAMELLHKYHIDFIALARYMQVLSEQLINHFPQRIINIHHSFLPAFKGAKPYHQAYEKGVKIIGATSHFVTPDLDQGPIIQQEVASISHRDTVDDLVVKGRDLERKVLAEAIQLYTQHRLFVCGNRTIIL